MKYMLSIWLFMIVVTGNAQTFKATADRTVAQTGEAITVTFTLNAYGEGFKPPQFIGFRLISGPSISTSTIIMNGKVSKELSFSYVLMPVKTGTLHIKPASIRIDNKGVSSNSLNIEVRQGQNNTAKKNTSTDTVEEGDLFIIASADKDKVLEGEAVTVAYTLYSKDLRLRDLNPVSLPSYQGFWTEELPVSSRISPEPREYKEEMYDAWVVKKTLLFPQRTGKLTIPPLELHITGYKNTARSIFQDFFNSWPYNDHFSFTESFEKTVKSQPFHINVEPLPFPKPENFSGLVGNLGLSSGIDKEEVRANEALTYKVMVGGEGNLKLLQPFELDLDGKAEVYRPKVTESLEAGRNITGTKTFEYVIVPKEPGMLNIPSLEFSYYDPVKQEYERQVTQPHTVNVLPAEPGLGDGRENDKEAVQAGEESGLSAITWAAIAGAPLLLGFIFFLFIRRQRNKEVSEVEDTTEHKLSAKLEELENILRSGADKEFHTAAASILYDYLELHGFEKAKATQEQIRAWLLARESEEFVNTFISLLDLCEAAKYAPVHLNTDKEQIFREINQLLLPR